MASFSTVVRAIGRESVTQLAASQASSSSLTTTATATPTATSLPPPGPTPEAEKTQYIIVGVIFGGAALCIILYALWGYCCRRYLRYKRTQGGRSRIGSTMDGVDIELPTPSACYTGSGGGGDSGGCGGY
ncbi:uncharacterized protein JN550_013711 [Neoarthrinium moseri]|uniref:uncharacterized protein n=1 Tax=Neoarthrinium moseri TaxID=1658444 RepID=UPI001FDC1245|nr:uncharacterized protein JN550_013711 [Neoarthrinium moseri]KAI1856693.1 hypothetical protein JN550_013711 [Neoarthrinium moseri]